MPRISPAAIVFALIAPVLALAAGCAMPPAPGISPPVPPPNRPNNLKVRVAGRVVTVGLEDYVAGTAVSEVVPVGESPRTVDRVYDVQTIVARTYAVAHLGRHRAEGFDLCDSTHCQVYEPARLGTSRFAGDVRRAAARTAGEVLTYGVRLIDALFHADCGGHTATPEHVWGTPALPYLPAGPDLAPDLTHRSWTVSLTRDEIRKALNASSRTAVGRTLRSIQADEIDRSGRVAGVVVLGDRRVVIRSDEFRAAVNKALGPKAIQSTRFSVRSTSTGYVLTGTGYGHGVGLCQLGTLARARRDLSADSILANYYPGARLLKLGGRIP